MSETRQIRILIADDHAVVRSGLHSILEMEGDLVVIAEASDGHQALALAQEMLPDIVLMDIKMGDWDGVTATRRIRNSVPTTRGHRAHEPRSGRARVQLDPRRRLRITS